MKTRWNTCVGSLLTVALAVIAAPSFAESAEPSLLHPEDLRAAPAAHSPADLDLTRRIRDALVASENLTNLGKNVAIEARDGQVTLTGLVTNLSERGLVGDIAARVAGRNHVDNQLEFLFVS